MRPPPSMLAAMAALLSLGGCGRSEREAQLEQQLATAQARAQRAEGELAKAQTVIQQQAASDVGFEEDDVSDIGVDAGSDELAEPADDGGE